MPKRDYYHHEIRKAFEKDGWTVTDDPLQVLWEDRLHFPDLGVERVIAIERGKEKLAVEIKSFLGQNFSHDFYEAMGQYDNYYFALAEVEPDREVVLAISSITYEKFFQKKFVVRLLELKKIPLVVIDVEKEAIQLWIR